MAGEDGMNGRAKKSPVSAREGVEQVCQEELGEMWNTKEFRRIVDLHGGPLTKCHCHGVHDVHLADEKIKGEEGGEEKNE